MRCVSISCPRDSNPEVDRNFKPSLKIALGAWEAERARFTSLVPENACFKCFSKAV